MPKHVLFIHGAGDGAYASDLALVTSLRNSLGSDYSLQYPQMPEEDNAPYAAWQAEIEARLAGLNGPVALVGHSVGGSVLLKFLCERPHVPRIAGVFAVATPYWGADEGVWQWEEGTLPADAASKLAGNWPLIFYHSRDDAVVPFAHLALYAAKFPRATLRTVDGRDHQYGNDLTEVAADIEAAFAPD
jgi:predicted alpha/beta hydrolase family esterase